MPKKTQIEPSSGSTRLRSASCQNSSFSSASFSGLLGRQVLRLGEVVRQVVQLPGVLLGVPLAGGEPRERRRRELPRRLVEAWRTPTSRPCRSPASRSPRSTARCAAPRRSGRRTCRGSSCRPSAPARSRRRPSAPGCRPLRGWSAPMSMQCVNCERRSPPALILPGQATTIGLRVPPRWLAICLPHWNGVLPAHAQAAAMCGAVWSLPQRVDAAVLVDQLELLLGVDVDAVQERHLVERAGRRPLQAGAVVAPDVEDQRVVEVAHLLDRVEQPADVPVGVLREARVDLHLPRVELLRRVVERVPGREQVGPLGQLRVLRDRRRASSAARRPPRGSVSQPWSNLPLYLSAHSFATWCGAWAQPVE